MSELHNGEPFTVTVTFHSDWMCGTGTGRHGATDRQVQRDEAGLPMVRGKALAAMLRDAAETVARGLDEGNSGRWRTWVCYVFGSQPAVEREKATDAPQPSRLVCPPLRLPEQLRLAIRADKHHDLLTAATVLPRAGVKIDPSTGTAAEDMLRVEERARAGLVVTAHWTLTMPDAAHGETVRFEAELLLRAAAKLVTALGGKRRRGAGACTVRIGDPDPQRLAALLDRVDEADDPPTPDDAPAPASLGARDGGLLQPRYALRITALSPVMINRSARGNVVLTERFVPGTVLLGLLAGALGEQATTAITGNRVAVTDACMRLGGTRSVPTPLCLRRSPTDDPTVLYNTLRHGQTAPGKPSALAEFCVLDGDAPRFGQPRVVEQGHGVIDDEQQRPTEDTGGLYINQAIAAGTVLHAEVWACPDVDIDLDRLRGRCSLGRSRKDDYGQVQIDVDPLKELLEEPRFPQPPSGGGDLVVWLQSDVLLRGSTGAPEPTAQRLGEVLGERLGVTLKPVETRIAVRRWESWQTRWGLPRPSLIALRGGSVVVFEVDGTVKAEGWDRVHSDGIGERTPEGFGRIALDPPLLQHDTITDRGNPNDPCGSDPSDGTPAGEPHTGDAHNSEPVDEVPGLDSLRHQAWRAELRSAVVTAAADDERRSRLIPPGVTAAQLGTLRALADQLLRTGQPDALRQWVSGAATSGERRAQWDPTREQLTTLLNHDGELWQWLGRHPPSTVRSELWTETLAVTLAEVARIAIRRARATGEPRDGAGA